MKFERFRRSTSRKMEDRDYSYDEFRSCAVKLRHVHALTALGHAATLKLTRPLANVRIYPCDYCDGLHITTGNNDSDYVQLEASLKKLQHIMSHPNFFVKAPIDVQEKYSRLVGDIQVRMVELEDAQ